MAAKSGRIVKSTCRMCHGVCGVLVHLDDSGRVIKIAGDPDCPTSLGYTCTKGRASPELLYHPDHFKYPLKRMGTSSQLVLGYWLTFPEAMILSIPTYDVA